MNALKIHFIIVLMFIVPSRHITADTSANSTPPSHLILDQWKAIVEQKFASRKIKQATAGHEFVEIRSLPETDVLLKQFNHNSKLEEELLIRIKRRCQKIDLHESYVDKYYSFLLCEVKGISVSALLELTGAHEQVLDHVITALFLEGERDSSAWIRSFKHTGGNDHDLKSEDPFQRSTQLNPK